MNDVQITLYRSSFFTTNPTTKMLSVLSAAKALYVRLQSMGQATNLDAGIYIYYFLRICKFDPNGR